MQNDLVLEMHLSPVSPLLAGFRLDAFSVIKPWVTHSPMSNVRGQNFLALMDDRYISPAVLYIQVSVLQVLRNLTYTALCVPLVCVCPQKSSYQLPCFLKILNLFISFLPDHNSQNLLHMVYSNLFCIKNYDLFMSTALTLLYLH